MWRLIETKYIFHFNLFLFFGVKCFFKTNCILKRSKLTINNNNIN